MLRLAYLLCFSLFLSLTGAAQAPATDDPDLDTPTIKAYVLSMDKLNRVAAAVEAIRKAREMDVAIEEEFEAWDSEQAETLAEKRARFVNHPKIFAFYQRQGLSMDDVVVGMAAAGNALVAALAGAPPPELADSVSPAQLQFARQNRAAMEKIFMELQ